MPRLKPKRKAGPGHRAGDFRKNNDHETLAGTSELLIPEPAVEVKRPYRPGMGKVRYVLSQ
jgi:hypothetical protein